MSAEQKIVRPPEYTTHVTIGSKLTHVSIDPAPRPEFERFEDLARKLAQTPKAEIDEKRRE